MNFKESCLEILTNLKLQTFFKLYKMYVNTKLSGYIGT